jgi:ATP-dependent RNA helicase DDX3X
MSGWDDMAGLKETLPETNTTTANMPNNSAESSTAQPKIEGWGEQTPYDYTEAEERHWEGNASVYEWDGEEGELGPAHPELEKILFGPPEERNPQGLDFTK